MEVVEVVFERTKGDGSPLRPVSPGTIEGEFLQIGDGEFAVGGQDGFNGRDLRLCQ